MQCARPGVHARRGARCSRPLSNPRPARPATAAKRSSGRDHRGVKGVLPLALPSSVPRPSTPDSTPQTPPGQLPLPLHCLLSPLPESGPLGQRPRTPTPSLPTTQPGSAINTASSGWGEAPLALDNKTALVNFKGPLERDAVRILRDIPEVTVKPTTPKGRADTVLQAGGVTCVVEVKAQRVTNAAAARQLAEYAKELPGDTHLIVVARTTTEDARQLLEEAGVGLFDAAGNMRVRLPGLFIWTEGRREAPRHPGGPDEPPVKLTGKAGVAAEALLAEPERDWKVRDLAERASVSTALAHRLLVRLERERLVEAKGAGPQRTRRVTNRTALLDLWAEEMRDRGIKEARAFRLARDPRGQAKTLSRFLVEARIDHAITGAAGAALLAPFITAIPVVDVWVTETAGLDEVLGDVRADRVHDGHNIMLRQTPGDAPLAFRQRVQEVWVANPVRLFYDLRQDPRRGREQADRLREEVIQF